MNSFPSIRFRVTLLVALGLVAIFPGRLRADVVLAWNEALVQISATKAGWLRPHLEARAYAMAHLAIEDAIRRADAGGREGEQRATAQRAAVVTAARDVLTTVIPEAAPAFAALAEKHLAVISDGPAKTAGVSAGRVAAAQLLQQRADDGWSALAWFEPAPLTAAPPTEALAHGDDGPPSPWLGARPFGLKTVTQYTVAELRTFHGNGEVVTDESLQDARFFRGIDRAAAVQTYEQRRWIRPLAWWNRVARQVGVERGMDLPAQARLLAGLNVALADATLVALHGQHVTGSWRAINTNVWRSLDGRLQLATDVVASVDNGHNTEIVRQESQRVFIPPVPNYPSVPATLAGAAQAALKEFFHTDRVNFAVPSAYRSATTKSAEAEPPRVFASFSAAAREHAFVSSLDGVHLREACVAGYALGESIGAYVGKRRAKATR